jgi:squalene-hopene/tetraprenyl-beta-curcumene cyclase
VAGAAPGPARQQRPDGHWVFELEADATIPSEYLMLHHFFGRIQPAKERRIGRYLRRLQAAEAGTAGGGWPLFHGGPLDISCSVKAYLALKLIGDREDAPHMVAAREAILAAGGAERSNVFTRAALAIFGAVPWRAVPMMPPEIMLLPRWFPFHISKISYWARTVLVPLTVVMARRPVAANPTGAAIGELFRTPPELVRDWPGGAHQAEPWASLFRALDGALHRARAIFPRTHRARAEAACERFVSERLNGEDGLGAIFPAMANAVMMYHCLGVAPDDPRMRTAWAAIEKLVQERPAGDETYVQPCLSPIWDTALASHALMEAGGASPAVARGLDWLLGREIRGVVGDWAWQRPHLKPAGWAFQYENAHYPDVDDTAVVVLAMDRFRRDAGGEPPSLSPGLDGAVARATDWTVGMQSRGGGWGAFDADNTFHYLNHIPFADHGALLDPPTADVSGRCLAMLAQLGRGEEGASRQAVEYLLREQEADGSWYGRWGVNYVYGTWSALTALNAAGLDHQHGAMRRAVSWLLSAAERRWRLGRGRHELSRARRHPPRSGAPRALLSEPDRLGHAGPDGGRGGGAPGGGARRAMAAGAPAGDGGWPEEDYTGTGFPRVFYLRYHGYRRIFPLWALARLRNLRVSNSCRVMHGL